MHMQEFRLKQRPAHYRHHGNLQQQVVAANVQRGKAIPSPGLDVLNKQQRFYDRDISASGAHLPKPG
ncbi:hypothetical protein HaLaN_04914, partial [Haematococcus lacustris]